MMKTKLLLIVIALFAITPMVIQAQNLSAEELAKANNPLASMIGANVQNYFVSKLTDAPVDAYMNTTWLRYIQPFANGKLLLRASLPISTVSMGANADGINKTTSGLGDFNAFLSFNFVSKPTMTIGAGPLIQAPSSTKGLGDDKWSAGLALVAYIATNPKIQYGNLITWQRSFDASGEKTSKTSELFIYQPFSMFQLGKGTYLRAAPQWVFNLQNGDYSMPMGVGIGKIVKVGATVFNLFVEPQYTMVSSGMQPQFQVFTALMMQFSTAKKSSTPPK